MSTGRNRAYWLTRALLAVSILLAVLAVALGVSLFEVAPTLGGGGLLVLGLPFRILEGAITIGLAAIGVVWMILALRVSRDEPPAWRYRDR
jgi:hypothetical protein